MYPTSSADIHHDIVDPFRRFSTRGWQNVHTNTVRLAMMCNVYFSFSKIL